MPSTTINREAGDSSKGPRLQLIRAIVLMLETIKLDSNAVFFTAVENVEDLSHQTICNGQINNYYEEDKNYDVTGNFTIFSPPVTNTLVSFFDIYIDTFQRSDNLHLGFYSTRDIGKERKPKFKDGETITLPPEPILAILNRSEPPDNSILELVKKILIEEYTAQYNGKLGDGHLEILKELTNDEFSDFLSRIRWHFGQQDAKELKQTALNFIENSPLHNNAHIGKEHTIFCHLMEKLSEFQDSNNLIDKLVNSSDVKLIFKEAESEPVDTNTDPTWKYIAKLEQEVTDKRNLIEKVESVIEDLSNNRIAALARKASASKYEEKDVDKTFLSLKYRVLEACKEYFEDEEYQPPADMKQLNSTREALIAKAVLDIRELKNDYQYAVSNKKTIEGIIWNLFDGCFLAFDEQET